ncbi:DUF2388 domain-containing protein [Pseudomonas sp. GOM6]|uniref:DUF2388 domain-containing protein n=1 Tax=Pseudomonas sp. GOM6 TaxID=3036944 RepID=UPI002409B220|nr:DUF2388 domain-containing protein [Pseudomonas sp. GOM6]MDG1579670.1 DUF2388 domain-containing protein [Pseudomonas sp. GOM6]
MPRLLTITSLALLGLASLPASADDTLRQILSSGATTASTYSTFKDHKLLQPAREDASAFIASDGAIRGAHLEAALQQLRTENPQLRASDAQLAQAILLSDTP